MVNAVDRIFSGDGFMPHGMCYLWRPGILTLHIAADLLITLAYFSIPLTLLHFVRRRRDVRFNWIFISFAVFIVACGMTHLMDIWVIWHPDYWVSGALKAVTAIASVLTAILLLRFVPTALALPGALRTAVFKLARECAEHRTTEEELRSASRQLLQGEDRALLAAIVESSDDAIISKSTEGTILSWNKGAERIFRYAEADAVGRSMEFLFPPDRVGDEIDILARVARGEKIDSFETIRVRSDGAPIDVSVTVSPIRNGDGRIIGASTIARDFTDRKRAEHDLAEQLTRLELLTGITRAIGERQDLPSISQVVLRTLEEQLPIDFGCLLSYQEPSALIAAQVGTKCAQLAIDLGFADRSLMEIESNGLSRCLRGELIYEPDSSAAPFPFLQQLAAGELLSVVAAPLRIEGKFLGVLLVARRQAGGFSSGECAFLSQLAEHVALATNQSQLYAALEVAYRDLQQTQQAALRQEKLRVLGQMASGIAHDINNALSPAAVYVDLLLERDLGQTGDFKEYLEIIRRAIYSIAQTVDRMKDFHTPRDSLAVRGPVQVNQTIEHVLELTRARWTAMAQETGVVIRVETELAPDLPALLGDAGEIRDALTNLILNAVDAMPQGGRLTLRSRRLESDRVQIEVIDSGVGMDDATLSKCLELFFTTKGAGGTGLGLAMVYGTVERHAGELQIDSVPGAGTTMRLIFPRAPATSPVRTESAPPPRQRPLRILVIDDDPLILRSLVSVLTLDGHSVEAVDGGQLGIDAFRAASEHLRPFDAVVTDLGMPHVDGRTVATAVKAMRPQVSVILLTGWGHRLLADRDTPKGVDRVLGKPAKVVELRRTLAELTSAALEE